MLTVISPAKTLNFESETSSKQTSQASFLEDSQRLVDLMKKKGPKDYVTKTDKRVEKILIEELEKSKKNYSFITEETGIIKKSDTDNFWIIDPIDGTTNFLHGIPHFAISVALKNKNEIIIGLIFDPIKNEMFFAEKDKGSFLNNQRIRVSKRGNLEDCLVATSGKINKDYNFNYRKTGCAALDLAYVACGRFDGYFQNNLNLWDIAAGIVIVKEAGGVINDIDIFNQKINKIIVSSNDISLKFREKIVNF